MEATVLKKNPTQLAIAVVGNAILAEQLNVSRSSVTTWDKQGYIPRDNHRRKTASLAKQSGLSVTVEMLAKDYEKVVSGKRKGE